MSGHINIHFRYELNDFLRPEKRHRTLEASYTRQGSIKDIIENTGIPHTEVMLILVNGHAVSFDYLIQHGDEVEVFPRSEVARISDAVILQPPEPEEARFVLDTHLGRLASYLRMLGFDTLYRNDYDDPELADISAGQNRILLTCDRYLLMRKKVVYGYFVRSRQPREQLSEVLKRYGLFNKTKPFSRCIRCNGLINPAEKQKIENMLMADTRRWYKEFWQCADCGHIYWKGSHYQRMRGLVQSVLNTDHV